MNGKVLISPAELSDMLVPGTVPAGIVVIDTRAPEAYAAGHIPGAVNIHNIFTYLATSTPEGMAELRGLFADAFGSAGLSGAETAVLYEQSMNSGFGQSCRGFFLLKWLGYPNAVVLHGGFTAWEKAGLPVTAELSSPAPKSFPATETGAHLMVDRDAMLASLSDASLIKLDVRDVDEWVGTSSSPYGPDFCPRKGRIPGAKWIEWYRMMKPSAEGPVFKAPEEIRAECESVGITPDSKVILYCFKGARASNTLVALHEAGVSDVRMYFGSWNEWSRDPALPIESGPPWAPVSA